MDQRPTVQRMQLGAILRRHRKATGIRQEDAAKLLECDTSKISRVELGKTSLRPAELERLLDHYGIAETEREELLTMTRSARNQPRRPLYGDVLPGWFRRYLDLESEATEIRTYEGELIPGLLQHKDYARALVRAALFGVGDDEVDRRVELRMSRKHVLDRTDPPPPRVCCVIGEAAFRRPIGGFDTMRAQIRHLLDLTEEPTRVTVQMLPFALGECPNLGVSFTLLSMDTLAPQVGFIDTSVSGTYLEPGNIASRVDVFDRLRAIARGFEETRTFLKELLEDR